MLLHLESHLIEDDRLFSSKEPLHPLDILTMLRYFLFIKKTRSRTESYIVVHTWRSPSCLISYFQGIITFPRSELHLTVSHLEYPLEFSYRLVYIRSLRIGSEICSPVSVLLSGTKYLWNRIFGDLDIRKILIIFHEDIILRGEMFDKIGLEDKSFDFCLTEDDLDIYYLPDHLTLGKGEAPCISEVG